MDEVAIVRSPGAGGVVGLAQFIEHREPGDAILVGGQSILGGALFNHSTLGLDDVRPIARLNAIALVVAVGRNSPLRRWDDLVQAVQQAPEAVRWTGGSQGSVDDQLIRLVARHLKVPDARLVYTPQPGGGDASAERVIAGADTIVVSSYEELAEYLEDGRLRALAVTGHRRIPNLDCPTLIELSTGIGFSDWKAVFAQPHLSRDAVARLQALIEAMVRSPGWRRELASHNWDDDLLEGERFASFIRERANEIAPVYRDQRSYPRQTPLEDILSRPYRFLLAALAVAAALALGLIVQRWQSGRHAARLRSERDNAMLALEAREGDNKAKLDNIGAHVNAEFARWALSEAERDVGWLILKGLSFKEIALLRKRSERTVRQQAGSIYAKSGLSSRSELSAYFLEDFFEGSEFAS